MTSRKPRIFYVGMVCTDSYVKAIREDAFVGAASGKMSSVVSALRLAGRRAVLISLPFVRRDGDRLPGHLCRGDGFPALFLPARRSPVARKAMGTYTLGWFALRRVRASDTVLFYNHGIEYLLALLILRLRGIPVFQDIEDVPIEDDRGLRGVLTRLGYALMFKLASPRKVTVSNQVGRALNLRDFLAIQGVAAGNEASGDVEKWAQLNAGAPLRVHYGGTLMASTGLDLFCAVVANLDATAGPTGKKIEFIITGVGELDRIRDLASTLRSDWLRIEVHQEIAKTDYVRLLDSCHASLSLRDPESDISSTTFPSKVIEITSRGLSLVTSQVSDVSDIFTDNEAWLLPQFNDLALSDILRDMVQNPGEVHRRAVAGQDLARARFAPLAVGRALAEFLEVGTKSA